MEKMPEKNVLQKKNGYPFTDFEIQDFEKLRAGNTVEFVQEGEVLIGKIMDIHSINNISVSVAEDQGSFSYGHTATLSYEDIKHSSQ